MAASVGTVPERTSSHIRDGGGACLLPGQSRDDPACPRCAAAMIWTKASWHCPGCRYKEGCCG